MNTANNIDEAINSLSSILESLEQKDTLLSERLDDAKRMRNDKLNRRVGELLPDISQKTVTRLQNEVRSFAEQAKIARALETHKKTLWIFKPDGYDSALLLLQAQLKLHLERHHFVDADNDGIIRIEEERKKLEKRRTDVLNALHALDKTRIANIENKNPQAQYFNKITEQAKKAAKNFSGGRRPANSPGQAHDYDYDDDNNADFWLWLATDVPTSLRNLVLDLSTNSNHSESGNHLRQTETDQNFDIRPDAASHSTAEEQLPLAEAASFTPIDTDDRLGTFS